MELGGEQATAVFAAQPGNAGWPRANRIAVDARCKHARQLQRHIAQSKNSHLFTWGLTTLWISSLLMRRARSPLAMMWRGSL